MRYTLLTLLAISLFFSCTEKETVYVTDHQNVNVDGNTAPPYSGVTTLQVQNYVNKTYIDLLGREPEDDELDEKTEMLQNDGLDEAARETLLNSLIDTDEYYIRFFDIYRRDYLNGILQNQIEETILTLEFFYEQYINDPDPFFQALAAALEIEIEKMELLQSASGDYQSGAITINEFIRRMAYNTVYDEINMGSENFVVACFNNMYKRNPTQAELINGITMVDGQPAQLLLQDGTNKSEFVDIMTSNLEFYQGLAFDIYAELLARDPSSEEMDAATQELSDHKNYQILQKKIMKSEEYAGF